MRGGTFLLVGLTTYVVFYAYRNAQPRKIKRVMIGAFVLAVCLLTAHIALNIGFVRPLTLPGPEGTINVSVGFERTNFAKDHFESVSDWDMLRARGLREEDIQELWTLRSLLLVRVTLFLTYSGVLVVIVGILSLGVLSDLKRKPDTRPAVG
jgi:hypothetical protein